MCCEAGLAPLNWAFSVSREGTLVSRAVHADAGLPPFERCPSAVRSDVCCLAGGPSAGSGSIESGGRGITKCDGHSVNRRRGAVAIILSSLFFYLGGKRARYRETNGYSIAEILLVFGIIAGVLVGVWAIYTVLSDEVDTQALVNDVLLLRDAAIQFRNAGGTNSYKHLSDYPYPSADALKPYLGQGSLRDGVNIFGGEIIFYTWDPNDRDLGVLFTEIPTIDLCVSALKHFGEVIDHYDDSYSIAPENTIPGFVGGNWESMGCEKYWTGDVDMYIRID